MIPRMKPDLPLCLLLATAALAACGPNDASGRERTAPADGAGATADHGTATELGTVTVAGKQFEIHRLGDLVPGQEGAFEVHPVDIPDAELAGLSLYLWVESEDGTQLSAPAPGSRDGDHLHFHVTPRKGEQPPHHLVLRLRTAETDERATLPL